MEPSLVKTPNLNLLVATTPKIGRRMASVKSKDTAPELLVRNSLHAAGFRYRLHVASLPGTPDVVLPKYQTVVFVHGCFWHAHGTACLRKSRQAPKANVEFWQAKFAYNQDRDRRTQKALCELGWRILVVWECELKKSERGATLHRLTSEVLAGEEFMERSQVD